MSGPNGSSAREADMSRKTNQNLGAVMRAIAWTGKGVAS